MSQVHVYVRNPKLPRGWEYDPGGSHTACPYCRMIGDMDDFDVMGLTEGTAQCLSCGRIVVPVGVQRIVEVMPLFGESA